MTPSREVWLEKCRGDKASFRRIQPSPEAYGVGIAILCLLLIWGPSAMADRRTNDILGIVSWVAGEYLGLDNPVVAENSSYRGRRYPPRSSDSYDEKYGGRRDSRRYNDDRGQRDRYSSDRYADREQNGRRYSDRYDDREQNDRRSSSKYVEQERSGGGRRYDNGKRAPYSSESSGNTRSSGGRTGSRRETSLDDAISRVREKSKGRVLSAETVQENSRDEHRVRIITDDGRVRRYRMDAETGNLLPRRR